MTDKKTKFIVVLEGGLVQGVYASQDSLLLGCEFAVVDYDTEGADVGELSYVKQGDGTEARAFVRYDVIEQSTIELED